MRDLIFKEENFIFSYRVAGVIVQNGRVLMQKEPHDDGHAFPGGHVTLGETHEQTLRREFQEELHADITVGRLLSVGEVFFPGAGVPATRSACTMRSRWRIPGRCRRRACSTAGMIWAMSA